MGVVRAKEVASLPSPKEPLPGAAHGASKAHQSTSPRITTEKRSGPVRRGLDSS